MPIGDRRHRRRPGRRRAPARGFSYLLLLFGLALSGAALAALGSSWQQAAQRGREAELIFRGDQIREALQRYHDASPPGQPRLPETLEALLADGRDGTAHHHLRRLWTDPFTGRPDWLLLRETNGRGIVGVRSRAQQAALRRHDAPPLTQPAVASPEHANPADRQTRVGDWLFAIHPLPVRGITPRHAPP